jgi:acyl-CoA hydrolase
VAIDEAGRPVPLPPIAAETEDERRRMAAAEERRALRRRRHQVASGRLDSLPGR